MGVIGEEEEGANSGEPTCKIDVSGGMDSWNWQQGLMYLCKRTQAWLEAHNLWSSTSGITRFYVPVRDLMTSKCAHHQNICWHWIESSERLEWLNPKNGK
eukprot:2995496-Ditylum_brightwellii.AAC.2